MESGVETTTKVLVTSTPGRSLKSPFTKYLWGYCFLHMLHKEADVICMEHQALNCKLLSVIKCPLKEQNLTLPQTCLALILSPLTLKNFSGLSTKARVSL